MLPRVGLRYPCGIDRESFGRAQVTLYPAAAQVRLRSPVLAFARGRSLGLGGLCNRGLCGGVPDLSALLVLHTDPQAFEAQAAARDLHRGSPRRCLFFEAGGAVHGLEPHRGRASVASIRPAGKAWGW
jgi:hypothetical protein